jgi:hypothetical protein
MYYVIRRFFQIAYSKSVRRIKCALILAAVFSLLVNANIAIEDAVATDLSDTKPPRIVSITEVPLTGVTGWARYQIIVEDDKNSISRSWGKSYVTNFNDPNITISSEIRQELSVAPTCRPWSFYGSRPILETREDLNQSSADGKRRLFIITLRTIFPLMSQNSIGQEPVSSDCFKLLNNGDWFLEYSLGAHFKDAAGNYNDQDLRSSDASAQSLIRTKIKLAPESIYCLPYIREITSTNPYDVYQLDFPWNEFIGLKNSLLTLNENQDSTLKQISEYVTPLSSISEIRQSIRLSNSLAKAEQLNAWNGICNEYRKDINWLKFQETQIRSDISYVQNFMAAAELKAKQEAEAKAAAELKAKQEAEAKAAAELKAKQEAAADKAALTKAQSELSAANAALADSQRVNREQAAKISAFEEQFKVLSESISAFQSQVSQLNRKLLEAQVNQTALNAKLKKICSAKPKPKGC